MHTVYLFIAVWTVVSSVNSCRRTLQSVWASRREVREVAFAISNNKERGQGEVFFSFRILGIHTAAL